MGAAPLGFAVGLLLAVCPGWRQPAAEAPEGQLDVKIPAADGDKYKLVRDAKDWANPYLVVRAEGVEVISKSLPTGRKVVTINEVQQVLIGLPANAWPYGRVAAVQEIGIRSDGDGKPIEKNKGVLKGILEKLKVKIEWWPSA